MRIDTAKKGIRSNKTWGWNRRTCVNRNTYKKERRERTRVRKRQQHQDSRLEINAILTDSAPSVDLTLDATAESETNAAENDGSSVQHWMIAENLEVWPDWLCQYIFPTE